MNIKQIIKFIIFVAIFYMLLAFNVFHLGEKLAPNKKDYLEINIPTENEIVDEVYFNEEGIHTGETGHFAGVIDYEIMRENTCKTVNICDKINFYGNYSPFERYAYSKAITKLVKFIDIN